MSFFLFISRARFGSFARGKKKQKVILFVKTVKSLDTSFREMLRPTSAGSRPGSAGSGGGSSSLGGSGGLGGSGAVSGLGGGGVGGGGVSTTHIPVGLQFTVSALLTDTVGLLLQPPSGVTLNAILRLPAHCAMRAHISCTEWLNAAPTAMGLSEEVAVRLFEAFSLLWQHQGQRYERRIEATRALLQAMSGTGAAAGQQQQQQPAAANAAGGGSNRPLSYSSVTAQRAVSLPGFMIFLAAQTFLERAHTNGVVPGGSSGANTPTRGGSSVAGAGGGGGAAPQIVPPETFAEPFLAFVRENLSSLMSFLCMGTPGRICVADLVELRILFREWDNGQESPFSTKLQFLWSSSGVPGGVAPPAAATIESQVLIQLLRSRLCLLSDLRGSGQGPASSLLLYRGVAHQTVHHQAGQQQITAPPGSQLQAQQLQAQQHNSLRCSEMHHCLRIQRCTQSTFFVLQPLPSVVISRCTNCIIFLGPVAGVLVVDRCEHCQIIALCAGVVIQGGRNVSLFLGTNTPPILVPPSGSHSAGAYDDTASETSSVSGGGASVYVAPYNTCYAALEEHCLQARVNPKLNLFAEKNRNSAHWNAGTTAGRESTAVAAGGFAALLPPAQYCALVVPPPISGAQQGQGQGQNAQPMMSTRTNPVHMPPEYAVALVERVQKCTDVSQHLFNAYRTLEANGRTDLADDLRKRVQAAFVDWLESSGQVQGLADLLSIGGQQPGAGAGQPGQQQQQQIAGVGANYGVGRASSATLGGGRR